MRGLLGAPIFAGQTCEENRPELSMIERGMKLAQSSSAAPDASGAQVAVLARAGQDLSHYGLRYSHLAFAYRVNDGERSVWRVAHKLNQCGTDRAELYRQGLGELFLDRPDRYEASFVVLTPQVQSRLLPWLSDNAQLVRWHEPRYSLVAYAWGRTYQQTNQWLIEVLAAAMSKNAHDRSDAQRWLQSNGFTPTLLQLDTVTRLGARIGMANVGFDDHPTLQCYSGQIETVGADTVLRWLRQRGLSGDATLVR
jgi:hypothetical protein